MKTFKLQC